jgi:hypothetical protein
MTFWRDPNDNVDPAYLRARGRGRQARKLNLMAGYILQATALFEEEVVMIADVRVEVRAAGLHHHLAQQAEGRELMQRVVHGSQGQTDFRSLCLGMELLSRDMTVAGIKQQLG